LVPDAGFDRGDASKTRTPGPQVRPEIHIHAHGHATIAGKNALVSHGGFVGGTTVDAKRLVVAIEDASLEIGGARIGPGVALQPRTRLGSPSLAIAQISWVESSITGESVVIVIGVQLPTNLKLLEVSSATDGLGPGLRLAQHR
jgi:hypothetical protein